MAGQKRRGYTVMEFMLVLAILVITTGMAIPMMDNLLASDKQKAAQDMLKSRLAEMRTRACEEGRAYRFSFTQNSDSFRIEPVDPAAGGGVDVQTEDRLPKDITFKNCIAISTGGEAEAVPTTEMIILPDGTCPQDYEISFGLPEGQPSGIRVRGVTGAMTTIQNTPEGNR